MDDEDSSQALKQIDVSSISWSTTDLNSLAFRFAKISERARKLAGRATGMVIGGGIILILGTVSAGLVLMLGIGSPIGMAGVLIWSMYLVLLLLTALYTMLDILRVFGLHYNKVRGQLTEGGGIELVIGDTFADGYSDELDKIIPLGLARNKKSPSLEEKLNYIACMHGAMEGGLTPLQQTARACRAVSVWRLQPMFEVSDGVLVIAGGLFLLLSQVPLLIILMFGAFGVVFVLLMGVITLIVVIGKDYVASRAVLCALCDHYSGAGTDLPDEA